MYRLKLTQENGEENHFFLSEDYEFAQEQAYELMAAFGGKAEIYRVENTCDPAVRERLVENFRRYKADAPCGETVDILVERVVNRTGTYANFGELLSQFEQYAKLNRRMNPASTSTAMGMIRILEAVVG